MQFELTGRHLEITPAIRDHVTAQLEKLDQYFKDKQDAGAHIVLTVEKNRQIVEIVVTWRDHVLKAAAEDKDMYQAVGTAASKIEKQARRMKDRVVNRKQLAKPTAAVAPEPDGEVDAAPLPPQIIPINSGSLKPMTPEEAVITLNGDGNQFVVFQNAETERVSVLYKRADGNFGLIQP